jgi:hypothetical protein
MELSNTFKDFLENTGIKFAHRNLEYISLNDLFVFPDLRKISESSQDIREIILDKNLWDSGNRFLILGEEQSGKTTLAKTFFTDSFSHGFLSIFLDASAIKQSKIEDQFPRIISEIYCNLTPEEFFRNSNNLVCIVDNISSCSLNKAATHKLLSSLNSIFPRTIFFAEETFRFTALDFSELDSYKKLEILDFGHVHRSELIQKWVTLGLTEETEDLKIFKKIDDLKLHVDSLVRKKIVPPRPIYILMLLQAFETTTPQRLELTSYGHCYQQLIYQSLERVRIKQTDVDTYLNVLSEIGGAILESSSESLDSSSLDDFFEKYSKHFLPVDQNKVIEDLIKSSILVRSDAGLQFRYRYLFYFFAAKKLAESLHKGDLAKNKIQNLVNMIHLEKSSNIVLFLTHHSKDPWILDQILYSVMDIFSDEKEATLETNSLTYLQDFINEIPELVLENRQAKLERLEFEKHNDIIEDHYEDQDNNFSNDEDTSDFIIKINKVFRAIEVCGQILRNRLGSLERDALELIVEESLSVSLRFLGIFLRWSDLVKEEAIREIKKILDQNPNLSDTKIKKKAESFYLAINYAFIFAMLQKVSFSLGTAKGREIYIKVTQNKATPASYLVQEIIELQFEKKLDFSKIEELHKKFSKNPVCDRLLKQIILHHCYMHDIGFRDRQRLSDKLNIPMELQQSILIESKKRQ